MCFDGPEPSATYAWKEIKDQQYPAGIYKTEEGFYIAKYINNLEDGEVCIKLWNPTDTATIDTKFHVVNTFILRLYIKYSVKIFITLNSLTKFNYITHVSCHVTTRIKCICSV